MAEFYWLQVIGNISVLSVVALTVTILAFGIFTTSYFTFDVFNDDDRVKQAAIIKWLRRSAVGIAISAVGVVFIPDNKELMVIYGIGGTIDYIKSNDKSKQLPDKCIDALTRYVDSIEKENEDNNK